MEKIEKNPAEGERTFQSHPSQTLARQKILSIGCYDKGKKEVGKGRSREEMG